MRKQYTFLYELTKANIKLQTENSICGLFWYLLGPIFLFIIMYAVFSQRLGENIEHFPLYLLLGIITWNFYATATARSMKIIVGNAGLLKSIPIQPKYLVLSAVLHAIFSHVLEIILFLIVLVCMGILPVLIHWYICILCIGIIFTIGSSFFLASAYVFFRDMDQIWSIVNRAWWFATPIFYAPLESGFAAQFNIVNPMYLFVHLAREALIYNRVPSMNLILLFSLYAAIAMLIGYALFYSLRQRFIDVL